MRKNFAALSQCKNDFIKLRIISARDPDVLDGYSRAWPEYFTEKDWRGAVALSAIRHAELAFRKRLQDVRYLGEDMDTLLKLVQREGWSKGCIESGIPTIDVRLPQSHGYGKEGIPATRGLLFQVGDRSEICNESIVRLYHTKWVVTSLEALRWGHLILAPLECIDLES